MKHKLLTVLFALIFGAGTVLRAEGTKIGNIWYELNASNLTAAVTYSGSSSNAVENEYIGEVTIPSEVTYGTNTYSVTEIKDYAFYDCAYLTAIHIPSSITAIGYDAFIGCNLLSAIHISSLTAYCNINPHPLIFAEYHLYLNNVEVTDLVIPNTVTTIGSGTFRGCRGLTSVTIPNSVTSIGNYAFDGCSGLTSVTIGNSVTSIGSYAFNGCSGLTGELVIPNIVTSIGSYAFNGCSGLTGELVIPNSVTSIGSNAFNGCSGFTGELVIPNSVTGIEMYVFGGCSGLGSVTFSNSVTNIGDGAFSGCSGLSSVTIPNSVTNIGSGAFANCNNLNAVYISDLNAWLDITFENENANPLYYAHRLYLNGTELTEIELPNSLQMLKDYVFSGYSGLRSITIPNSLIAIGANALAECTGLSTLIVPNSVLAIGNCAFSQIRNVVYFGSAIGSPWCAEYVNAYEEGNLLYEDNSKKTIIGCSKIDITEVTIPSSVTHIYTDAFVNCVNLNAVYINDLNSWMNIYFRSAYSNPLSYAHTLYVNGEAIQDLRLLPSTYHVSDYAFYECSYLTSITIPDRVYSIGDYAFYNCDGVSAIYNYATTPQSITSNTLYNINRTTCTLYVPEESIEAYRNADIWGEFVNIQAAPPMDYTHTFTIQLYAPDRCPEMKPEIEGEFIGENYVPMTEVQDGNGRTYYTYALQADDDFYFYLNGADEKSTSSLQCLQDSAYWIDYYCKEYSITPDLFEEYGIEIPETSEWKNFGSIRLNYVDKDTTFVLDFSDNSRYRFAKCDGTIRNVLIGDLYYNLYLDGTAEVTNNGSTEDSRYHGLTNIEIPSSVEYEGHTYEVTKIGSDAFWDCEEITSVTLPNTIKSIGYSAFQSCVNLASLVIPNTVTTIEPHAFYYVAYVEYHGEAEDAWNNWWGARSLNGYKDGYLVYSDESKTTLLACLPNAEGAIDIPNSVTIISEAAFYSCKNVTSITMSDNVDSIAQNAFTDCYNLRSITLSNNIREISRQAFQGCNALEAITIPNNVTKIGEYAFVDCYRVKSVVIPEGVKILEGHAFAWCSALKEVIIPSTVDSMGRCIFYSDYNLSIIHNNATTPQNILENVFYNVDKYSCILCVPEEAEEAYRNAEVWKDFLRINPNYTPTNLHAEPGFRKVTLSWEVDDEADNYLVKIYYNGEEWASKMCTHGTHATTMTIENDTAMTFTWRVEALMNSSVVAEAIGEAFTIAPSPYNPTNLQATPNGDGTYTITWEMESTEDVLGYYVEMIYVDGVYYEDHYVYSKSCRTDILIGAGEYSYRIIAYDHDYNYIGFASSSLIISPTEPRDITLRTLIQTNSNFGGTTDFIYEWYNSVTGQFESVNANNEGEGWFNYTFTITDPVLQVRLMYMQAGGVFDYTETKILTSDTCFEYSANSYWRNINCDAVAHDYKPYNLQAIPGDGKVTLSWSTHEDVYDYSIYLYNVNGNQVGYSTTNDTTTILYISTDSVATFMWEIVPYVNGIGAIKNAKTAGNAFTVNPSPYIPQNLQATSNGDGTYTITWDAVDNEDVKCYYVNISGASDYLYYGTSFTETSHITPVLPLAGEYTYTVYASDSIQYLGSASSTITVSPVESHDITVRVLVQPSNEINVNSGIYFGTSRTERVAANDEGNGWYNYTFTTTDPGIIFYFYASYNSTSCSVYGDTCLMYSGRFLQSADCEAQPQTEFDITMNILDVQNPKLAPEWVIYNMSNERGTFRFVFNLPEGETDIQSGKEYTMVDMPQATAYYDPGNYANYMVYEDSYSSYIYYDSVSFVKTIDTDSILCINAVVISKNGVTYRLHYTHDLHYLMNDESEEDFIVEFADYQVEKFDEDTVQYLLVTAENNGEDYYLNNEGIRIVLIVPGGVNELPLGTYPIENGLNDYTVLVGMSTSNSRSTLAYRRNNFEQAYWLMVSGSMTIDANKNIMVDALNSYGRVIRCSLKNPEVTGIDLIQSTQSDPAQKVMINGQIYILRGEKVYTVTGQKIK